MVVVDAVAVEDGVPGGAGDVGAAVFVPVDVGLPAQDAGALLAYVGDGEEWADVEADAVVEVGVPAEGLLRQGLPADEDVVGRLALDDEFETVLQVAGSLEPSVAAVSKSNSQLSF